MLSVRTSSVPPFRFIPVAAVLVPSWPLLETRMVPESICTTPENRLLALLRIKVLAKRPPPTLVKRAVLVPPALIWPEMVAFPGPAIVNVCPDTRAIFPDNVSMPEFEAMRWANAPENVTLPLTVLLPTLEREPSPTVVAAAAMESAVRAPEPCNSRLRVRVMPV